MSEASEIFSWKKVLPSELDAVDQACLEIRNILEEQHLSQYAFAIELTGREALNNALLHAHKSDPKKEIEVCLDIYTKEFIMLQIQDSGPGFDWQKQDDQALNLDSSHGRGLAIYRAYTDKVEFNEQGNQITLWFLIK